MKQTIFSFLLILVFFPLSLFAQQKEEIMKKNKYSFSFQQGDSLWQTFATPTDRIVALQIPDSIIQELSTTELLELCLHFPYLSDIFAYNDLSTGFNAVISEFNGFRELLKRSDIARSLLSSFDEISNKKDNKVLSGIEKGKNCIRQFVLTYMLGLDDIQSRIKENERIELKRVVNSILNDHNQKEGFTLKAIQELSAKLDTAPSMRSTTYYQNITRYTPKGTSLPALHFIGTDYDENTKASFEYDVVNNYGGIVLSEATLSYNCHAYAWHMSEENPNDTIWIGTTGNEEDIYWEDGSFVEVTENNADKVSYAGDHSALRINSNWYKSKWGSFPLVKHHPNNVPSGYLPNQQKKFYKFSPYLSISGNSHLCGTQTFSVSNLPSNSSVNWSFMRSPSNNSNLTLDYPSANMCQFYNNGMVQISDTLVAVVSKNGQILSKAKKYTYAYLPFYGTYSQTPTLINKYGYSSIPETPFSQNSSIIVNPDCYITIVSEKFKNMTLSCIPHLYSNASLTRLNSTTIQLFVNYEKFVNYGWLNIYATSPEGCDDFYFTVQVTSDSNFITPFDDFMVRISGSCLYLSIEELNMGNNYEMEGLQKNDWNIIIKECKTGNIVYTDTSIMEEKVIDIKRWNPGLYVVEINLGGRVLVKKFMIGNKFS